MVANAVYCRECLDQRSDRKPPFENGHPFARPDSPKRQQGSDPQLCCGYEYVYMRMCFGSLHALANSDTLIPQ